MTRAVKIFLGVVLGAAIVAAVMWSVHDSGSDAAKGILGRPLRVGIVSWPGYAAGIVANNGFKPNKNCIFWKQHKLEVEFLLLEDVDARAKAFARGGADGVDIMWSTVDFWANELPGLLGGGVRARAIMQVDWSRGGDAIIADARISRIEDLKDKRIALALFTPSQWLLEHALQKSLLDEAQREAIVKSLVSKTSSPDARADFVAGRVDAAVVWEPDVSFALAKRAGAHVLLSTKTENALIADLMVAQESFIQRYPEVLRAFVEGWLVDGTQEANRKPDLAVKLLMENEPLYKDLGPRVTQEGLTTVRWADLSDNTVMFGLDGSEPAFDRIFKAAGATWVKRRFIKQPLEPGQAKDDRFVRELYLRLRR
jgi:NitT/TauT family transport system substrate-binding protein